MTRALETLPADTNVSDLVADINLLKVRVHKLEDDIAELRAALAKLKGSAP